MKRILLLAVLVASAAFASGAQAHSDRIFEISSSGALLGFPEKYGPASVKVVRFGSKDEPKKRPEVAVTIGSHTIELPTCYAHLFMQPPRQTLRASGSWYHDFSILPPYLNLTLPYRESAHFMDGYSLLFDIESGRLMEVRKHQMGPDGESENSSLLSESQACEEDLFGNGPP